MIKPGLLLIDSNPAASRIILRTAIENGYEVATAPDSEEFRDLFVVRAPSVVVFEVEMPGYDGIETLRWLAQQDSSTKIIVLGRKGSVYQRLMPDMAEMYGLCLTQILDTPVIEERVRQALSRSPGFNLAARSQARLMAATSWAGRHASYCESVG